VLNYRVTGLRLFSLEPSNEVIGPTILIHHPNIVSYYLIIHYENIIFLYILQDRGTDSQGMKQTKRTWDSTG
jgi:hypothetical protein